MNGPPMEEVPTAAAVLLGAYLKALPRLVIP